MSGVRVTGIDGYCPEGLIWEYFMELCKSDQDVTEVYYPLLNNDAVVIFRDRSVTAQMLTKTHQKWKVLPLPNQVFTKQRVWVDKEMTAELQARDIYMDDLKGLGGVETSVDKPTQQLIITGQPYQIEWAWRYLSAVRDKQEHLSGAHSRTTATVPGPTLSNGDTLTNGDAARVSASASERPQSVHGTRSPRQPRLHDEERSSASASAAANSVTSLAIQGLNNERPSSSVDAAGIRRSESQGRRLPGGGDSSRSLTSVKTLHEDSASTAMYHDDDKNMKRLQTRSLRQADADDTFNAHASLPAGGGRSSSSDATRSAGILGTKTGAAVTVRGKTNLEEDYASPRYTSLPVGTRPGAAAQEAEPYSGSSSGEKRGVAHTVHGKTDWDHTQAEPHAGISSVEKRGAAHTHRKTDRDQVQAEPHASSSKRGMAHTVHRNTEQDQAKAEATHRAERQNQSLGFRTSSPPEDDSELGAVGGYQSLQSQHLQSSHAGHRGSRDTWHQDPSSPHVFASLQYPQGASSRVPDTYGLISKSAMELSRKHFDIDRRLTLKIYTDDITKTRTDAVVNAANWELKNIGGVAGALARAAGPEMTTECERLYKKNGSLATAQVVKTKAYGKLSHMKYVLHTVGPIYNNAVSEQCVYELTQTFYNCLEFADKLQLESVTFPFISTGIFGMPIKLCVQAMAIALRAYGYDRLGNINPLQEVHFINNDVNVVVDSIFSAEDILKVETVDSAVRKMEEGKKLYGRRVYPHCVSSARGSQGAELSEDDERYGRWDSTKTRDVTTATEEASGSRHRSRQRVDSELLSLPASSPRSDTRQRSGSLDRTNKSAAKSQSDGKATGKSGGRDPSPVPKPRTRSNSFSSPRSSAESSPSAESVAPTKNKQPTFKKALTTLGTGAGQKKRSSILKSVGKGRMSDHSGNDTDQSSAPTSETEDTDSRCPICLDIYNRPKTLSCGHRFCTSCVDQAMAITPRCPKCQRYFGVATGTQPKDSTMSYSVSYASDLPGYRHCGTITINYYIPSGRQEACHPSPGCHYSSTQRTAYLPNNKEGQEVLKMLQKAFDNRLVFTVGDSATTGARGVVVWNDIHHKTSTHGGPTNFGYPDPGYLMRVKEELAAKGITRP